MALKNSKDLVILLLAAKGHRGEDFESISGRTRLMKMVFLFEKEVYKQFKLGKTISADALPNFEPYDYGPYSGQVYSDIEFLVDIGLVAVDPATGGTTDEINEGDFWRAAGGADIDTEFLSESKFRLTDLGKEYVQEELTEISSEQWNVLHEFKARCTGTSLKSLLRYVYTRYEDMTTNSKIRDAII